MSPERQLARLLGFASEAELPPGVLERLRGLSPEAAAADLESFGVADSEERRVFLRALGGGPAGSPAGKPAGRPATRRRSPPRTADSLDEDSSDSADLAAVGSAAGSAAVGSAGREKKSRVTSSDLVCGCNALRHELIGNCIKCGKIACGAENHKVCNFCGSSLVPRGKVDASSVSDESAQIHLDRAVAHKEKLLGFQKHAAERTKVYDDQRDWFVERSCAWLSKAEKDALQACIDEEREGRKRKQMALEIGPDGLRVVKATPSTSARERLLTLEKKRLAAVSTAPTDCDAARQLYRDVFERMMSRTSMKQQKGKSGNAWLQAVLPTETSSPPAEEPESQNAAVNFGIDGWALEEEIALTKFGPRKLVTVSLKSLPTTGASWTVRKAMRRLCEEGKVAPAVQTRFERMQEEFEGPVFTNEQDQGVCLTLHQPWASLIISGHKRFEGRVWRTGYRGRLWIHAGAAAMSAEGECALVEYAQKSNAPVPQSLPRGCLLGCVDLIDVLTQEQFAEVRLEQTEKVYEENESAYLFVCGCPRRLPVPISIGGMHKLWKMPEKLLPGLQRALRPVQWITQCVGAADESPFNTEDLSAPPGVVTTLAQAAAYDGPEAVVREWDLAKSREVTDGAYVLYHKLLCPAWQAVVLYELLQQRQPWRRCPPSTVARMDLGETEDSKVLAVLYTAVGRVPSHAAAFVLQKNVELEIPNDEGRPLVLCPLMASIVGTDDPTRELAAGTAAVGVEQNRWRCNGVDNGGEVVVPLKEGHGVLFVGFCE